MLLTPKCRYDALTGSEIYRADDEPYYYRGNKVLISVCALSLIVLIAQRQFLASLNRKKEKTWQGMTAFEHAAYQNDSAKREVEGNKRLEFRHKY